MDNEISPSYYKGKGMKLCDIILAFDCNFFMVNVIKYPISYSDKNEKGGITALRKIVWYANRLIEHELKNGKRDGQTY